MNSRALFTCAATALCGPWVLAQDASTPTRLDEVVVSASPVQRTLFEQAQPVSILSGERLRLRLQPTLGETLSGTAGVSSSYFGPAASRPVIRGLDADRIRILQNGINTIDASATSVDHAVSFDPVSVESIEVVRGPATLLYGPNAIGGIVNAIDNRIPDERIDRTVRGRVEGRYGSVNTERGGAFTLEGGLGGFQWHIEGYKRATDDLDIPGYARSARLRRLEPLEDGEREARGVLPNSDLRTEGLAGGASYVWEDGYIGAAYSGFHTNYGTVAEPDVTIDMEQRRFDFRGAFFRPFAGVKAVKYSLGVSDYEHTEFEGAIPGTRFENEGYDGRLELSHEKIGPFEGTIGFQSEKSDFSAAGEESFLPPVETRINSGFIFEEWVLDPKWRVQMGGRYDHVEVESDTAEGFGAGRGRTFNNLSGSAGVIFSPVEAWAVALNVAFTQRAPTYQELFANGPHIATNAFEIGDADLGSEKALSVDLSLRRKLGRVTGAVSVFYNRFSDFIGQFATGEEAGEEGETLPVVAYRATNAEFLGGEAELTFHLLEPAAADAPVSGKDAKSAVPLRRVVSRPALDLELKADYVRAEDLETGRPLPRIPPFHARAALRYSWGNFRAGVETEYAAEQDRVAQNELPTDSYWMLHADIGYRIPFGTYEVDAYARGVNLTDEEARLHTSFLKDIAPLGGRGVIVGLRATF